jgi:RimJ/RimL family protein N-acetyltransferase
MIISRYGISLERVQKDHIEMIRHWRNDPKIRDHMFYKGEITPEMQREWFASICNEQNFYFLVCHRDRPVGLISISSIDYEHRKAFAGLFIYDDDFMGTDIPVRASLCLLDFFFAYTNIETVFAKVRDSNTVADGYNTSLGFERIKKIELGQGYEYGLEKENYFTTVDKLRRAAMKIYGAKSFITFRDDLLETSLKQRLLDLLASDQGDKLAGLEELEIL